MNIQTWVHLPRKIVNVVRALRRESWENRVMIAEVLERLTVLGARHEEQARLLDQMSEEVREQGVLLDSTVRIPLRAAAEMKLRDRLPAPPPRTEGVSILIACWNHAGFLPRAVESAVAAMDALDAPAEVLILDDASRDGSREVAQRLARMDQRIHVLTSDENLGLPRARNTLLDQSSFEHAMILDADNQLVPSGVAALYASARRTGAVMAYGNIAKVDQSGSVQDVISNERVTPELLSRNWIDALSLLRTRRILELGGYDCQWLYGLEDWELNQRLLKLGELMAFVPVLVGKYTMSPTSMLNEAVCSIRFRRNRRIFGCDDATNKVRYRACVHHPAIGTLWSSPGWTTWEEEPPSRPARRPASRSLKVLVVSSGGVQNHGDDAILMSTLQRLGRIRPGCLAAVVTDGPNCPPLGRLAAWLGTTAEFVSGLDLETVRHGCAADAAVAEDLSRRLELGSRPRSDLNSFDVVLMAGGGNLNSYWPNLVAVRTAIAAAARAARVPYILSGQGVGPISNEIVPMLSFLVAGASAVATRDLPSRRMLEQLVPNSNHISMVGDDALGLSCDSPLTARNKLARIGVPLDRPLLAFQARDVDYVGFSRQELQATARIVDDFAADRGYIVVAVPINAQPHGPEVNLLLELTHSGPRRAPWHVANHSGDVAAISGMIKICTAVMTHSYHVAVFALENRVPTLLFARTEYYHLKAEALRSAFGIPVSLVASPNLSGPALADQLERISRSPWSPGMTSGDVDAWLDRRLPREGEQAGENLIFSLDRAAWSAAG